MLILRFFKKCDLLRQAFLLGMLVCICAGGSSRVAVSIRAHVGDKEANAVFASLYIVRSDLVMTVRQAALQVSGYVGG